MYKCRADKIFFMAEHQNRAQFTSKQFFFGRSTFFIFFNITNHIFIESYVITYATEDAIDEMHVPFTFTCLLLRGGVGVITKRVGNRGNTIQNYRFT